MGTVTLIDEKKLRQSMRLMRLHTEAGGRGLVGRLAQFAKSLITRKDFALLGLLPDMFGILHGKPTWSVLRSAYFKSHLQPGSTQFDPARDGCGLMWLAPALPMTGGHAKTILALVAPLFVEFDFNMSACLTMMNQRTLFLLLGIFFDQEHELERQRATELYRALQAILKTYGYQQYRSGTPAWEGSAHVNAANSLLHQIKMAVDPAQILSPGRYQVGSVSPAQARTA